MAKKTRLGLTLALILAIASTTIATLATSASQNKFEVYVPDKLELRIAEDGTSDLVGKQNIFNASTDTIKVKEFKVTGLNGWTVVDYSNDFDSYPDNSKYVGVQINGVSSTSANNLSSDWKIASGEWLNLGIDIKVPNFTEEVSLEDCLDISYKFEWATSSGGQGDGNTDGSDGNTDGSDNGDDLDPSIEYKDFIITPYNKNKIGYTGDPGETLVIPKIFKDVNGTWYKVTKIDSYAFQNCENLKSVTIPDSVKVIGDKAFFWCKSLESINIPSGIEYIAPSTFSACTSLTSVSIPDSVAFIYDSAFLNCSALTSITIPDSVTTIDKYAFGGCGLTSVSIPDSVTEIRSMAFSQCKLLETVTISGSVTTISDYAFNECTALTSVDIHDGVKTIANDAFRGCTALTSVTIPGSLTKISYRVFYNCTSLTSVIIPNSVTSIDYQAFYNVPHIEYHGTASGQPWGAKSMN